MDREKLIAEMSLEEKFRFLTGAGMNHSVECKRLGISSMRLHDGPYGLRMKADDAVEDVFLKIKSAFPNGREGAEVISTAFPSGAALGAAWDPELVFSVGEALGEECRMYGVQAILGPSMNIKRHPLCGRNFEYFSEDPILTEALAEAYVEGVQSQGVAACPKHFAMNNQERGRFSLSSEADERTMREVYLRAFEGVVKKAAPWSLMCSYNRINGILASENGWLLREVLRKEWGFDGIVVSDWGAVKNRAYSLLASVDLCMPYQEEALRQLEEAYRQGDLDDEVVDEAVGRLLTFYERTRLQEEGAAGLEKICDLKAHHGLALKAARESMVLLKNEDHILPLKREGLKRVLVVGERARSPYIGGDGSSRVANPYCVSSPLEELKQRLGDGVELEFLGDDLLHTFENEIGVMEGRLCRKAAEADVVLIFAGQEYSGSSEAVDRTNIELEPYMEYAIRACHRVNRQIVVVLNVGSALSTRNWNRCAKAILVSWLGGQAMGQAIAETLCGENNPSGKLAETIPGRLADAPGMAEYPGDGYKTVYREGLLTGYRYYQEKGITPDYPFGFGLSYSDFTYVAMSLKEGVLRVSVKNNSERDGEEIIQVYVQFPQNSWASHPPMELKAFRRVFIKAGDCQSVEFEVTEDFFTYYNVSLRRWVCEEGEYTIYGGPSSTQLPLSVKINCKGPRGVTMNLWEE